MGNPSTFQWVTGSGLSAAASAVRFRDPSDTIEGVRILVTAASFGSRACFQQEALTAGTAALAVKLGDVEFKDLGAGGAAAIGNETHMKCAKRPEFDRRTVQYGAGTGNDKAAVSEMINPFAFGFLGPLGEASPRNSAIMWPQSKSWKPARLGVSN